MTPLEILKAARAKIEKPECWGKGPRYNRQGTCCAGDALSDVTPGLSDFDAGLEIFERAINVDLWGSGADWNDAPERTHTEVLAAFDRAIELAAQA